MRYLALCALVAGLAQPLAAQGKGRSSPWVKYGKWGLLVVTVGLDLAASEASNRADESFDQLTSRCFDDPQLCVVDESGNFVDGTSEALFQRSLRLDRSSRRFLIAGQTALLGAAVMFIYEFTKPTGEPDDNVPFAPRVQELRDGVGVGLEVRF